VSSARWFTGDTREVLRSLPDASVDLVLTSPPFLALRSYLPADHPDKGMEIGSESNPGAFLDVLLDVTEELGRVLAPHGSLCVELGDTYSGSTMKGGSPIEGVGSFRETRGDYVDNRRIPDGWPLAKSLCMIPHSYAWALAYGRNPWTGRETDPWRVRNLIAWCRPNPPVGALGDKFRPGTSYMTVACKSGSRYFDLDAVREPAIRAGVTTSTIKGLRTDQTGASKKQAYGERSRYEVSATAPPLDWWEIPTHPDPGSHYATFPSDLCVRPIKAMCPQKVCRVCGKPSERIVETERVQIRPNHRVPSMAARSNDPGFLSAGRTDRETIGWSDCGHNQWRTGVVLDPFAGSGTTLSVATGHGRDAIGIDLDPRNYDLARERIGMFLEAA
jgi:site-specific DNA-methyltransferase (adenine-specific)